MLECLPIWSYGFDSQHCRKPNVVLRISNPILWEMEARYIQGHPLLHDEFEVNLDYMLIPQRWGGEEK